jgi:hypothetical protein
MEVISVWMSRLKLTAICVVDARGIDRARGHRRRMACQSGSKRQIGMSDRNDAIGIARIMQAGW